jgi:hypothetical protein
MRSHRLSAPLHAGLLAVLLLLCAGPLAAYTIWLKDGTSVAARGKYQVKNGKAIITLVNGEQSSLDAALIDVARTEAANRGKDYGATDLGNTRVMPGEEPAPPADKSLHDLVATHRPSSRELPAAKRTSAAATAQAARSRGGFLDLSTLQHVPYAGTEVAVALQQFFRSQGIEEVQIWSGTQPDRPLVEVTAGSEASVFQSLTASANALLRLRERFPQAVAALEVVMKTPAREKAGQFVLTPEIASDLVAKKVEVAAFFVAYVQF